MDNSDFNKRRTLPIPLTSKPHSIHEKIPEKIGPYKIEALLDKGGMSFLYLGVHPILNEPITIKVLYPEYISNPEMVQRFMREAEIIELADHPNIVKLYGQDEWEGGLYIAMEFVQGISLKQYLRDNPISLKHALEIILEVSVALCHLHAYGVIHRDLKPENILITESGGVKVIDFGISQLLIETQSTASNQKRLIGTPVYMSPEQKENPELVSYQSDIYSLGIIAYELVLGKLSRGQIYLSLMPKGLQKILAKALQPKLEDRYLDIVDFMSDLSSYLHSQAFLTDSNEMAPLSNLLESLRRSQEALIPSPPHWPNVEMGVSTYKKSNIANFYYDFFKLPPDHADDINPNDISSTKDFYAIAIGIPLIKGSPSLIYTSILRGMVRSLSQMTQHPEELVTILNKLVVHDPISQIFAFSYLVLLPEENKFRYVTCGGGQLLFIKKGSTHYELLSIPQLPLGSEEHPQYKAMEHQWEPGDTIFYYDVSPIFSETPLITPEQIQNILKSLMDAKPQKQTEAILRKVKISRARLKDDSSLVCIGIKRS